MKQVVLISELGSENCTLCAHITESIWDYCKVNTLFTPEYKLVSSLALIGENDLVIAVGYKEMLFTGDRLSMIKDKLILITPSDNSEDFDLNFFNQKFSDDIIAIINVISKALKVSQPQSDTQRYDAGLKVIIGRCRNGEDKLKKIINLHSNFYLELIKGQPRGEISALMILYEKMRSETDKLMSYVSPLENICFLMVEDSSFFRDELIIDSETKGYPAIAVQYKERDKYVTLYHETGSETTEYFDGKFTDTNIWKIIISKTN